MGIHVCMHSCEQYHILSTMQGGRSPLYMASQEGHIEVVDILLTCGADPNLAWTVWGLLCSFCNLMCSVIQRKYWGKIFLRILMYQTILASVMVLQSSAVQSNHEDPHDVV